MADKFEVVLGTDSITVPKAGVTKPILVNEGYFAIRVAKAQVAFRGNLWDRVDQLVVLSKVTIDHPAFGSEPITTIQATRKVEPNQAFRLGLATDLIALMPASFNKVRVQIDFVLDKKNRLAALANLIDDKTLITALSLAPGVGDIARRVSTVSKSLINTFLPLQEQEAILKFEADLDISAGGLSNSYYVIVGTKDEKNPLPSNMSELTVKEDTLYLKDEPVKNLSYIILNVTTAEERKWETGHGPWRAQLDQVSALIEAIAGRQNSTDAELDKAASECERMIYTAYRMLQADPLYLPKEALSIVRTFYANLQSTISSKRPVRRGGGSDVPLKKDIRELLEVKDSKELAQKVSDYKQGVNRSEDALKELDLI
jgi:hypothetical protein